MQVQITIRNVILTGVCVPSLNFVGLPVRKILGIYCVSINPPGDVDLDLWSLNPQNSITTRVPQGHSLHQVWTLWDHSFLSYAADKQTNRQTNRLTRKSYPRRPTGSAWVITIRYDISDWLPYLAYCCWLCSDEWPTSTLNSSATCLNDFRFHCSLQTIISSISRLYLDLQAHASRPYETNH